MTRPDASSTSPPTAQPDPTPSSRRPDLEVSEVTGSGVTFRVGDVVAYLPDERPMDRWWCKEGTAVAADYDGRIVLADTYWQSTGSEHVLTATERATAKVQFNLGDYEQIDSEWRWEKFAEADRQVITSQHRLQRRYFIRRGATESLDQQLTNAWTRVQEAREKVSSAVSALEWATQEWAELKERSRTTTSSLTSDGGPS